jgi:hypothetical protein
MAQLEIAWCKLPQWGAALVLLGIGQACANEYPIAPTFCDDFCRATLRPQCDSQPEDCVRECELQDIAPACESAQRELLACYTAAPDDAFVCWGWGSSVRVRDGVCETERDALLVCELPTIEPCLDFCRPYQRTLDQRLQSQSETADAAVSDDCALLRQSCEGICWNLLTIGAPEVNDSFGRGDWAPGVVGIPTANDAGAGSLLEVVESLLPGCGF